MTEPFGVPERDIDHDHMVETPESLRDGDPEALPMDRGLEAGEGPLAADRFGTTHAEESEGESLDIRIGQEVPDVGAHDPIDDVVAADPETFGAGPQGEEGLDEETLADAYGGATATSADVAVGRVVEPDEGAHTDVDKDAIARDVGIDGGDLSAEEAAMHVVDEG